MFQIAPSLLTYDLSRYTRSIHTSIARVVISFHALGLPFYVGITAAEDSSLPRVSPFALTGVVRRTIYVLP